MKSEITINSSELKLSNVCVSTVNSLAEEINSLKKDMEEKKMNCEKILSLYEDNKIIEIKKNYETKKIKILEKDELYVTASEMINQINTLLENDGQEDRLEILGNSPRYLTNETKLLLLKLEQERKDEGMKLDKILQEVRAMLEIAPDYKEAMKILERYKIIDKQTKKIISK